MRLVFIHGIHEEHHEPAALRQMWENALVSAWERAGLAKPHYTLEMPYFGRLLADLAEPARGGALSGVVGRDPLGRGAAEGVTGHVRLEFVLAERIHLAERRAHAVEPCHQVVAVVVELIETDATGIDVRQDVQRARRLGAADGEDRRAVPVVDVDSPDLGKDPGSPDAVLFVPLDLEARRIRPKLVQWPVTSESRGPRPFACEADIDMISYRYRTEDVCDVS